MPAQKPGKSKQDYVTPSGFIHAVKLSLGIDWFAFDFAADETNYKSPSWWGLEQNSLLQPPDLWAAQCQIGWGWLNPPFANIAPWAQRCVQTKALGGAIAFLVPAAVGSNWFRDYVDGHAKVLLLNGRLAFMQDEPTWGYPKDCILALYAPDIEPGYQVWTWPSCLEPGQEYL